MTEQDHGLEAPSGDELIVAREIALAREEGREISDAVARMIASMHHGGQTSALYSFASCGAIDLDRLAVEFIEIHDDPALTIETAAEVESLMTYVLALGPELEDGKRGPVEDWHKLWGNR